MGFTPDTIKQTLLGFISSQAAVSEKYTILVPFSGGADAFLDLN